MLSSFSDYQNFDINPNTGRVTLAQKIANTQDQITNFDYTLIVIGTDDGGCCGSLNSNTGTGTLVVNILTENEFRPVYQTCRDLDPKVEEEQINAFVTRVGIG